jgi:hypothetical protein
MRTMKKAATVYLFSSVAMGCFALAMTTVNCGGTSGERPGGSGGTVGTGGTAGSGGSGGGSGGSTSASTSTGLNCASAITPANGTSATPGVVTDFTDWNNGQGKWGTSTGVYGSIYAYAGPNSTKSDPKVEGDPRGLHLRGSVAANDYGGGGLGFSVCATVASFTQLQFTVYGSAPGCDLELQIQTFDQRPTSQTPPGGCDSATTSCYGFPVVTKIVDVSTPITTPLTVTKALADFSNWSTANANQVVGLQWQFTGTNVDPDASAGCPIDVTITDARFLP